MQDTYDVLIVGGGMTGASLACALGGTTLRVGVIEAIPIKNGGRSRLPASRDTGTSVYGAQPSFDTRTTALTWGTRRILEAIGVWQGIAAHAVPIKKTHVSERGQFGFVRLDCADYRLDALGYVVENRLLGKTLLDTLRCYANIEFICPARVQDVVTSADAAGVTIQTEQGARRLNARLLVIADGRHSTARHRLGIKTSGHAYGQSAIITSVTPQSPHQYTAYERFTPDGPLAVLPMSATRCAVVWVVRTNQITALLALNESDFLARLQEQFGARLGRFSELGARRDYPLELMRAEELTRARAVLIGNAAHTLHPVAAQGLNLGLRDVAVLARLLCDAVQGRSNVAGGRKPGATAAQQGHDPGDGKLLEDYARLRRSDHAGATAFTDGLVRVFSNDFAPLALARNIGLLAADLLPLVKNTIARRSAGLAHAKLAVMLIHSASRRKPA